MYTITKKNRLTKKWLPSILFLKDRRKRALFAVFSQIGRTTRQIPLLTKNSDSATQKDSESVETPVGPKVDLKLLHSVVFQNDQQFISTVRLSLLDTYCNSTHYD
jgi:hypothetical protein